MLATCTVRRSPRPYVACGNGDDIPYLSVVLTIKTDSGIADYVRIPEDEFGFAYFPEDWEGEDFELQLIVEFWRGDEDPFRFDVAIEGTCQGSACTLNGDKELYVVAPFKMWTIGLVKNFEEAITAEVTSDSGQNPFKEGYYLSSPHSVLTFPVFTGNPTINLIEVDYRGNKTNHQSIITKPGSYTIQADHTISLDSRR